MQGKSVIVTGAAGGLGKATSVTLAKAGATIGVLDVNLEGAERVVKDIEAVGGKAYAVIGDITKRADAFDLFDRAAQKLGRVDGLINNAGIYPRRPIMEITDEEWTASLGVNVRGLYNMTVAAIAHMGPAGGGRIVNIASIDAFKPHPKNSHYAATKAAVVSLTKTFGLEVAPQKILVNAVAPGPIATETAKKMGFLPQIEAETPIGHAAEPEDIAELIMFLVSDRNRYMVGETVVIAGGYYIP